MGPLIVLADWGGVLQQGAWDTANDALSVATGALPAVFALLIVAFGVAVLVGWVKGVVAKM